MVDESSYSHLCSRWCVVPVQQEATIIHRGSVDEKNDSSLDCWGMSEKMTFQTRSRSWLSIARPQLVGVGVRVEISKAMSHEPVRPSMSHRASALPKTEWPVTRSPSCLIAVHVQCSHNETEKYPHYLAYAKDNYWCCRSIDRVRECRLSEYSHWWSCVLQRSFTT